MILSITDEMMDGYMDIKRFNQFNIHEFEKSIYNIEKIDGYEFYLEKLGNSNILDKYSETITTYILDYYKNYGIYKKFKIDILIKELGINKIFVNLRGNISNISKKNDYLLLDIMEGELNGQDDREKLLSIIDHELQHIYINEKGNITKNEYHIVNKLVNITHGLTRRFLNLYYLSFQDEISANIHMFHREIGNNNIHTKEQFKRFLTDNNLYKIVIKMMNIDEKIDQYKNGILKEGNEELLVKEFNTTLDKLLNKASKQIKEAGKEYKLKLSKTFSF